MKIENIDPIGKWVRSKFTPFEFGFFVFLTSLVVDIVGGIYSVVHENST
jgi:hypothetical protein